MRDFLEKVKNSDIDFFDFNYRLNSHAIPKEVREPQNVPQGTLQIPWCGYADDLTLCKSKLSLEKATPTLEKVFASYSLSQSEQNRSDGIKFQQNSRISKGNSQKNPKLRLTQAPKLPHKMDDKPVINSEQFRVWGTQFRYDDNNTRKAEIETRIDKVFAKFASSRKSLKNKHIRLFTQMLVLNAEVKSRLTFSGQIWTTKRNNMTV